MKFSILVLSSFSVACCVNGYSKHDEVQYRNHKTSSINDTQYPTYKHSWIYPAQVYTNPFNELTTLTPVEQSITITESPMEVVRLFITPTASKRKQDLPSVVTTTQMSISPSSVLKKSSNWVTAKSVIASTSTQKDKKFPFYSPVASTTNNIKIISEFRPTVIAIDNDPKSNNKLISNGTAKIIYASKTQRQMPSNLLYATTTGFPSVFGGNFWNSTSYAITTKVSSVNSSKPFTTVLVPKQMLDGTSAQRDYARDESFRPFASPVFLYKQNVDTNNIENRRVFNIGGQAQTSIISTPKLLTKYETTKKSSTGSYEVKEEDKFRDDFSANLFDSRSYNVNNKRDRIDQIYVPPIIDERLETEKPIYYQTKYDPSRQQQNVQHNTPKFEIKYGFAIPESFKYKKQSFENVQPTANQFREFYPATEISPMKDVKSHPLYNSAGTFETRMPVNEITGLSFEHDKPSAALAHKNFSTYVKYSNTPKESNGHGGYPKGFSSSHDWPSSKNFEIESSYTDKSIDDVNAKDILKSLLLDILKSKQKSEIKSSPGIHEIIDSYYKTNRPNVDLSLDNYNIETDMSCNLRSTKYITDGQCVTTKPVVEAVCADRCLVYSSASPVSGKTKYRSTEEQVEALHCVDGDSKLVRVQLKCRDGNILNNVIKVVTNCRCKLHQIQPQMRSNGPKSGKYYSSGSTQDVMNIDAVDF